MRKFVLFLFLITSTSLFSQWSENFNDGNFSSNPIWTGNAELFNINSSQQLQLNASTSGNAFLSTQSKLQKGTTWEFWIKLNFNPSQFNYSRIYLASDNADPALSNTGYYLTIGGINDKVNLTKRNSSTSTTEIIPGESGQLNLSSVSANIKVEFTHESVWRLFVKLSSDADYVLKGEFVDNTPVDGNFFILNPTYTSSNVKNFFFDDFNVTFAPIIDVKSPVITNLEVANDSTLYLTFDEEIDISQSQIKIDNIIAPNSILLSNRKILQITNKIHFSQGIEHNVTIEGVKDLAGNVMNKETKQFTFWNTLNNASAGDVVITEIMANPSGAASLPEVEYVEIHNNADSRVNLAGWQFYYGDKSFVLPESFLLPDSFVVLANASNISRLNAATPKIGISSFPTLSNTGKLLLLENPQGELISFANYNDTWYGDDFKSNGGFSLECIDPTNISGSISNWKASSDKSGGTPGKTNSISAINPDNHTPEIVQKSLISSDSILLTFNDVMIKSELCDLGNYTLSNGFQLKTISASAPIPNAAILVLNRSIQYGEILTIEIKNIHSISGNSLNNNKSIRIALSEVSIPNDVIINEILFNPRPGGVDYIELFNRSMKIIDLSKLFISAKKSDGSFQSGIKICETPTPFFPHEYLLLTTDKENILKEYYTSDSSTFIQLSSLPSMSDNEGNIQIINSSAEVIDGLFYSEKMHHPFVKNPEGVSLERINSELPTTDSNNWTSASTDSGWGTPGKINSQNAEMTLSQKNFWLENETITPNNDGLDDILKINYALDQSGYSANIRIYSSTGELITILANNIVLGTEGLLTWKGVDTSGKAVDPGIYILYIEYHTTNHLSVIKKIAVVVGN